MRCTDRARVARSGHSAAASVKCRLEASHPVVDPAVRLQRAIGNNELVRLLQPKLEVTEPGDKYEREADETAERVLRSDAVPCRCGGTCSDCQHSRREEQPSAARVQPSPSANLLSGFGAGRSLNRSARDLFEARFNRDFSHIRIHDGPRAERAAKLVGAHAFTLGSDVVFGRGQYRPGTPAGRRLLAHELVHTIQQGRRVSGSAPIVMRRWDEATSQCADEPSDKSIDKVVVQQEAPQSVTVHWDDGTTESGMCSAGKGHCCVDASSPEGVACTVRGSRVDGSNCTPITRYLGYRVKHRDLDHKGIPFWTEFVPSRGIALHQYPRLDGTALSHGCVRLNRPMAKKIFCGARQDSTWVQVQGFARPSCDHPALRREWEGDFSWGGRNLSDFDGDADSQASILETRRMLNASFGRRLTVAQIRSLTADDIPRCRRTAPLPVP